MLVAARNILKAWLLVLSLVGIFGLVGWLLDGVRGLSIFVFCALLVAAGAYWTFDRVVIGMVGARELPVGEAPLLHSTVERLASRAGILKPRLYLIPRRTADRGRDRARRSQLRRHREHRLRRRLCRRRSSKACSRTRSPTFGSTTCRSRRRPPSSAAVLLETSRIGGWFERSLLFVLAPVAAACVHLLVSPKREFAADRFAAKLCDSPHGLADALGRLEQASELVAFEGSPATEPLFTINPFAESGLARLFVTHPPIAERVRRLSELDPTEREQAESEAAA